MSLLNIITSHVSQCAKDYEFLRYQYESLGPDEIRLVRFKYVDNTTWLSCEFRSVSIKNPTILYTAISYCWGSPDLVSRTLCPNGRNLRITKAVEEIRHWLIGLKLDELYWIDFLSINQDDVVEKAAQVNMMDSIFSLSQRVDVWLGRGIENGEGAIQLMKRLETDADALARDESISIPSHPRPPKILLESDIRLLESFFSHPWFRRIWILQEVVLASEDEGVIKVMIHHGNSFVSWHPIALTALWVGDQLIDDCAVIATISVATMCNLRVLRRNSNPPSLGQTLLKCISFQSSNPRDMVYATKNLCKAVGSDGIPVNYTTSVKDLYCQTAFLLLTANKSFEILAVARLYCSTRTNELPSWAPDWRIPRNGIPGALYAGYKASEGQDPDVEGDWSLKTLTFMGISIDTYLAEFPFPQSKSYPETRPNYIKPIIGPLINSWISRLTSILDTSPQYTSLTQEQKKALLARVIVCNSNFFDGWDDVQTINGMRLWLEINNRCDGPFNRSLQ